MHDTRDLSALFPQQSLLPAPPTALALLDHERILEVSGVDATRFLQGQLTCDVATLPAGSSTLGARCNPKGRMQSSFRLLKLTDDHFLLAMDAELLEPQQTDLAKYAAFFKVKLSDCTDQWVRLGLWGQQARQALAAAGLATDAGDPAAGVPAAGLAVALAEDTLELWLPADRAQERIEVMAQQAEPDALNAWQLQLIRLGIGQVHSQTRESFIPQMLNLQHLGGVSFRKGCYTGQEIVARMQYLGKLKKRMYRLTWAGDQLPAPGAAILDGDNGRDLGEVVAAARGEGHIELLAVLQNEAAQSTTLCLSDISEPPLAVATLPYDPQLAAEAAGA